MSFFSTTHTDEHRTLVAKTLTRDNAIAAFRDPVFLVKLDNDYVSHETDTAAWPEVDKEPKDKTTKLKVTANVSVLPKAIWSGSSLSYRAGLTQVDNGVKWFVSSSLGMDQASTWTIEPATQADLDKAGEKGASPQDRYVLSEKLNVKASRLLMGTIKGRMEADWHKTHGKVLAHGEKIQAGGAAGAPAS